MKKFIALSAVVLFAATSFAFKDGPVHLKGVIEDSTCANSKTNMGMGTDRINCAKKCIKMGAKAVLVADGKIYQIANQKSAVPFAGQDVVVDGTLTNDSINVTKIAKQ